MVDVFGGLFNALGTASLHFLEFNSLVFLIAGTLCGLLFGAIPGLGGTTSLALLIPLTFGMDKADAIMLMGGSMAATSTGGSISAILLNTPGIAPNAATMFDGFPLAQQGRAGEAIGAAATASALGGLIGVFTLILVIPIAKQIVLLFSPPEFFLLAVFGLCAIAVSTGTRLLQALIAAIFGFICAFVGFDYVSGIVRYTYGIEALWDGIKLVPALIGLFAISQMIDLAVKGGAIVTSTAEFKIQRISSGIKAVFKNWSTMLVGSAIGTFIGAVPGVGGTVAAFLSYSTQVQRDPTPDVPYGQGNIKGVIAPESANNAKDGGSLIPTLAFGIPGSAETAVFLGALVLHGLEPGPRLLFEHEDVVFTLILTLTFACVIATLIVLVLAKPMAYLTLVDAHILAPTVTVVALVGAYALQGEFGDVVVALAFAVIGYLMIRFQYPRITFTIALVLGEITERSFFQTMGISDDSWAIFVTRNVSLILIGLIIISLMVPSLRNWLRKRREARGEMA
ncbi:MAG: tripartite tricarboxylate transporter permease [Alphaproteobacteria bacterium]|nr:tripartite tricarboxylate transporter permease [Alphaproteobacteria bacterium]MCZ6494963.1 tripartite tricarboxylate transporter permease [Alphaproteobacteria bacterium]